MNSPLPPTAQRFILHWGEMGVRWGINRSVGQIHALLYLSADPVPAELIADSLGLARSNVSTSLRELQTWGLLRTVHLPGDRRDHFQTYADPWEMFRRIAAERKKRELDPTQEIIAECVADLAREKHADPYHVAQLEQLSEFFSAVFGFYNQVQALPTPALKRFSRLGAKALRVLGLTGTAHSRRGDD